MFDGVDPHAVIVFGSVVTIVFITMLSSVIKAWIKKDSGSLAGNQEFLAALREFKEKTDRRLTRIEKVIDDISSEKTLKDKSPQGITAKNEKRSLIDLEIESQPEETGSKGKEKLKNMLD